MSTTSTINSGAINAVSFPGSEAGASLIELIGEVAVTCAIGSLSIILTCSASTDAAASTSLPGTKARIQIGASADVSADSLVTAASKLKLASDPLDASGVGEAAAGIRLKAVAATQAGGDGIAVCAIHANRSASTSPAASSQPTGSVRKVFFSADISPFAATASGVLQKINFGASSTGLAQGSTFETYGRAASGSTQAQAVCSAVEKITKVYRTPASVNALAVGTAATVRHATAGASQSASAVGIVFPQTRMVFAAGPQEATAQVGATAFLLVRKSASIVTAATNTCVPALVMREASPASCVATSSVQEEVICYSIPVPIDASAIGASAIQIHIPMSASVAPAAECVASANMIFGMEAVVDCTASAQSAAIDFAVAASAPVERQMFVEASDRRMEVQI